MVAEAIPEAGECLACVARMTEQAADRTLNAIDLVQPLQDQLATRTNGLAQRWDDF